MLISSVHIVHGNKLHHFLQLLNEDISKSYVFIIRYFYPLFPKSLPLWMIHEDSIFICIVLLSSVLGLLFLLLYYKVGHIWKNLPSGVEIVSDNQPDPTIELQVLNDIENIFNANKLQNSHHHKTNTIPSAHSGRAKSVDAISWEIAQQPLIAIRYQDPAKSSKCCHRLNVSSPDLSGQFVLSSSPVSLHHASPEDYDEHEL